MAISPVDPGCLRFADLVEAMRSIADAVEARGAIVGHVKAYARQGGSTARASVTAAGMVAVAEGAADLVLGVGADIQLVAIALLADRDDLIAICKDALRRLQ